MPIEKTILLSIDKKSAVINTRNACCNECKFLEQVTKLWHSEKSVFSILTDYLN